MSSRPASTEKEPPPKAGPQRHLNPSSLFPSFSLEGLQSSSKKLTTINNRSISERKKSHDLSLWLKQNQSEITLKELMTPVARRNSQAITAALELGNID